MKCTNDVREWRYRAGGFCLMEFESKRRSAAASPLA
jgi:hypothetical protein